MSQGLTKPKSLWRHFTDMYRALGFRHLFLNTAQPIIISVALMIGFIALFPLPYDQYKYTVLFAAAPVFFIFAVLLTETAERMSKLYELKMTCKYTIRQIAAFRVLCFSLMGTVLCTLANLFIRFSDMNSFFRALSLSLCALFLFSFLGISVMRLFPFEMDALGSRMALDGRRPFADLAVQKTVGIVPGPDAGRDHRIDRRCRIGPVPPGNPKAHHHSNKERWLLMLAVNHVTKKYGTFTALEDITIEFTGGVYGLLSPNGSGKTTLIKMLATLLFPTSGEILWEGMEIAKLGERYREVIGYLPQDFGYYKHQSPRQFLHYLAALKGIDRSTASRKVPELLQTGFARRCDGYQNAEVFRRHDPAGGHRAGDAERSQDLDIG